jgi:putative flippase GtrA
MIRKMFASTPFFRFGLVGVANTATDFVLFAFLVQAVGMHVAAANVLSYSAGVLQSFTLNSAWTFRGLRSRGTMPRRFAAFCLVNVVSLAVTTALVWLLSLIMPALLAKAASVGAGFLMNFQLSRRLVFGERRTATGEASSAVIAPS